MRGLPRNHVARLLPMRYFYHTEGTDHEGFPRNSGSLHFKGPFVREMEQRDASLPDRKSNLAIGCEKRRSDRRAPGIAQERHLRSKIR